MASIVALQVPCVLVRCVLQDSAQQVSLVALRAAAASCTGYSSSRCSVATSGSLDASWFAAPCASGCVAARLAGGSQQLEESLS